MRTGGGRLAQTIKKYQKKADYSFTFGAFPTFELLQNRPDAARTVYVHSRMDSQETMQKLKELCDAAHVHLVISDKQVERLREKDNVLIIGVFDKYESGLMQETNHVVLVNPSDMGNLGTILRTSLGFGIHDIAIIEPAADVFHPKVIRSSMGAMFRQRISMFNDFAEYKKVYGADRLLYPFVLHGKEVLQELTIPKKQRYALIFGNEATGLPKVFESMEHSVTIRQSAEVDSFNLSLAVGMAVYKFTEGDPLS